MTDGGFQASDDQLCRFWRKPHVWMFHSLHKLKQFDSGFVFLDSATSFRKLVVAIAVGYY